MRSGAAAWREDKDVGLIDLDQLAVVAARKGKNAVVSRAWLRQALKELTAARSSISAITEKGQSL